MGGIFKFQVQDSFLEYFYFGDWRFEKNIALSEKKPLKSQCNTGFIVLHCLLVGTELIHGFFRGLLTGWEN